MSLRTPGILLKKKKILVGLCFFHRFQSKICLAQSLFIGPFSQKLGSKYFSFFIMELPHEYITDLSKDGFVSIDPSPLSIRSKRPPQMLKQPNNGIILARTNLRPQSMTQIESKQKRKSFSFSSWSFHSGILMIYQKMALIDSP